MGWRTMRPNSSSRNLTRVPASILCLRRSPAGTTSWPLDVNVPLISFMAYILSRVRHTWGSDSTAPTPWCCTTAPITSPGPTLKPVAGKPMFGICPPQYVTPELVEFVRRSAPLRRREAWVTQPAAYSCRSLVQTFLRGGCFSWVCDRYGSQIGSQAPRPPGRHHRSLKSFPRNLPSEQTASCDQVDCACRAFCQPVFHCRLCREDL